LPLALWGIRSSTFFISIIGNEEIYSRLKLLKLMGAKPGEGKGYVPPTFLPGDTLMLLFPLPNFCMTQSQSSVIKLIYFILSTTWS